MEPFKIPESLKSLTDPYPHPKDLLEVAQIGGDSGPDCSCSTVALGRHPACVQQLPRHI